MHDTPGVEDRLALRWREDELRGVVLRRAATGAVDNYVDTAMGLFVVLLAGFAVPAAMTQLMMSAGIAGWMFPALVAGLFFVGVALFGASLVVQLARQRAQRWFGVEPWRFVLTPSHLVWSGPDAAQLWVPGRQSFVPGLPLGRRRLLLPLSDIEAIGAVEQGLQIELVTGGSVFFDVDPVVAGHDLETLCDFVRSRADVAREESEGREVTTRQARRALADLPRARFASERQTPTS